MSVKADTQPLEKSVVTMLPVINLSATNMTALHSLLCFVVEQSKNNNHAQCLDKNNAQKGRGNCFNSVFYVNMFFL